MSTAQFAFVRDNVLVHEAAQGETLARRVASGWRADEAAVKAIASDILKIRRGALTTRATPKRRTIANAD